MRLSSRITEAPRTEFHQNLSSDSQDKRKN